MDGGQMRESVNATGCDPLDAFMESISGEAVEQDEPDADFDFAKVKKQRKEETDRAFHGDYSRELPESKALTEAVMDTLVESIASNEGCFPGPIKKNDSNRTRQERISVVRSALSESPYRFLVLYGRYLSEPQLQHFEPLCENYEIWSELTRIRSINRIQSQPGSESSSEHMLSATVRNRRYNKLQSLLKDNEGNEELYYFSDKNMRERAPGLFHFYVGQYEQGGRRDVASKTLADVFLSSLENDELDRRRKAEQAEWGWRPTELAGQSSRAPDTDFEEEFDSESEDEGGADMKDTAKEKTRDAADSASSGEEPAIERLTDDFCVTMRRQLVDAMCAKFLRGDDACFFDYATVDSVEDYDDTKQIDQDAEDRWFESDE